MTNPDIKNPRAEHNFVGRTCSITAVGSYVPEKVLTNAALEELVDTNDEWIITRTGIRERRIAADDEYTSDLGAKAAKIALERANVDPADVDLIILATITPDMPFPATACLVQEKIGAHNAAAFDIEAACSGFVYALEIGQQFIMSRTYDTVLVIGAENSSNSKRLVDVALRSGAKAARLIASVDFVDWSWFEGVSTLGITAGASAPEILVDDLIDACRERFDVSMEEIRVTDENVTFKLPRVLAV